MKCKFANSEMQIVANLKVFLRVGTRLLKNEFRNPTFSEKGLVSTARVLLGAQSYFFSCVDRTSAHGTKRSTRFQWFIGNPSWKGVSEALFESESETNFQVSSTIKFHWSKNSTFASKSRADEQPLEQSQGRSSSGCHPRDPWRWTLSELQWCVLAIDSKAWPNEQQKDDPSGEVKTKLKDSEVVRLKITCS